MMDLYFWKHATPLSSGRNTPQRAIWHNCEDFRTSREAGTLLRVRSPAGTSPEWDSMLSWTSRNRGKNCSSSQVGEYSLRYFSCAWRSEPWGLCYTLCTINTQVFYEGSRNGHGLWYKNQLQWWKEYQRADLHCCCKLSAAPWWISGCFGAEKSKSFGIVCTGLGSFCECPLNLCFSKSWKQRNKDLKVTQNTGEIQDRLKREAIHHSLWKNLKEALT